MSKTIMVEMSDPYDDEPVSNPLQLEHQETITWHKYPKVKPCYQAGERNEYWVQTSNGDITKVRFSENEYWYYISNSGSRFLVNDVSAWAHLPKGWVG